MNIESHNRPSSAREAETVPDAGLVEQLRSSLGKRYGDPNGWSIRVISEQGRPGRERRLLRARHAGGQCLAIKQNSAPAHNRRQYRALRNLRRATPECVAPHYISEDAQFFVMDWVDAPLLGERLTGPERLADLRRMGSWLARLQSATTRHPLLVRKPYSFRSPTGDLDAITTSIEARLRARLDLVSYRDGPLTMLHGDLHPGNVFVTEEEIVVFDRKLDRYGTAFIDIAAFLISLGHLRALAAAAGHPWSGNEEEDRKHFFEGFGAIQEGDLALYDLIEDITIFQRWLKHGSEEDPWFYDRMRSQGLIEPAIYNSRPGRMVVNGGSAAYWTSEHAPPQRRGVLRRVATRLGLSL